MFCIDEKFSSAHGSHSAVATRASASPAACGRLQTTWDKVMICRVGVNHYDPGRVRSLRAAAVGTNCRTQGTAGQFMLCHDVGCCRGACRVSGAACCATTGPCHLSRRGSPSATKTLQGDARRPTAPTDTMMTPKTCRARPNEPLGAKNLRPVTNRWNSADLRSSQSTAKAFCLNNFANSWENLLDRGRLPAHIGIRREPGR